MRRRLIPILPLLLGAGAVLAFFGRLATPSAVLAVRDVPLFHLPLRAAFADLALEGLPAWNPLIHGGQPVLSNPNYAAFYPPTWLGLALPAAAALNLVILLHAVLGFAGAWRLARRLGCGRSGAAVTALAFTGGGAFVASASSVTPFCGLAWLPWILGWGEALFDPADRRPRWRRLLPVAAGLALQLLAGEPVVVATTGLGLACLALARPRPGAAKRLAFLGGAALLAALFASVQLLPTLARLSDSPRGGGLELDQTAVWSLPPARLVEWLLPRFYGDPMRGDENLYFGWRVHDGDYPYLISVYPGALILILGLAALLRWPIPRRGAWAAMLVAGIFLALGRRNPLYAVLAEALPLLGAIRYPEKFALLSTSSLAFAAGLGWDHLLRRRREGHSAAADFPLAMALAATAVAGTLCAALWLWPELGAWFVGGHTILPATAEFLEHALDYLRSEAAAAVAVAAGTALVLAACRLRRLPETTAALLALGLLGADLVHYNRGLTPTVPVAELTRPPEIVAGILAAGGGAGAALARDRPTRIFTDVGYYGGSSFVLRSARPGPDRLWTAVERLDPYLGNLWGLSYALNEDFDLMLTSPARSALELLDRVWDRSDAARALLGAWSVDHLLHVRPMQAVLRGRLRGSSDDLAERLPSPHYLPLFRFPERVELHRDRDAALAAAIAGGLTLGRLDHWLDPADPNGAAAGDTGQIRDRPAGAEVLGAEWRGRRVRVRYRAPADALLTAAITYHPGWRATVDGLPVAARETVAGQIGLALPAGEREVELVFWEPSVTLGAAVSLASIALAAALLWIAGGRRSGAARAV